MALDPVTAGLEFGGKLVDKLFPDKQAADLAKLKLAEMAISQEMQKLMESSKLGLAQLDQETQIAIAQAEVNKIEASQDDLFRGGWRPAIGWVCALAFGWSLLIGPVLVFVLTIFGIDAQLPEFPMESLMTIMLGLLGLGFGAYRTFEKVKLK